MWYSRPPSRGLPGFAPEAVTGSQDQRCCLQMTRIALAVVLVVAACSSSSAPTALSSPSATVTPSPAALEGDLPVWVELNNPPASTEFAGGFVHFPGGLFRRDPHADMLRDTSVPNVVRTKTPDQPYLYAGEGSPVQSVQVTYDRAVGRWLPVNQTQVAADGLQYAYIDYESGSATPQRVHIVNIRSASDEVVYRAPGTPVLALLGLVDQNIYLADCQPSEVSGNCWGPLWRVDATTGSMTLVSDHRGSWVINGRSAWVVTCWPAEDPVPCFGSYDKPEQNQLLRLDLVSGNQEAWDRGSIVVGEYSGDNIHMLGFDIDGKPVVSVNFASQHDLTAPYGAGGESVVFRLTAPEHSERLFSVPINISWAGFYAATADRVGIWLQASYVPPGNQTSVLYLYSKASGGREMSPDFWAVLAGPFG